MLERLADGARRLGLPLSAGQLGQFDLYLREMLEWNRKVNLTGITDPGEVETRHFLDSLSVALAWRGLPWAERAFALVDVGSGAGLPGIPIKIARPDIRLVLIEATAKKAAFMRHAVERLGLANVEVLAARAEDVGRLPEYRERFDMAACRAVSRLSAVAELTLPLCRVGGLSVIMKKGDIELELGQARKAIRLLGGQLKGVTPVDGAMPANIEGLEGHLLVLVEKESSTPDRFPRRAGMPARHPLG